MTVVDSEIALIGCATTSPVQDERIRHQSTTPTLRPDTKTQIDILAVTKKVFVKTFDQVKDRLSVERGCTAG
jgi:hypothetical protein